MDWNNRQPCQYDDSKYKTAHHFMVWLHHSDPSPEKFYYRQKKGVDSYGGSMEGELIKCDLLNKTFHNCVEWCKAVYSKVNGRETPGISVWPKIFYKGLSLDEIRAELKGPKAVRTLGSAEKLTIGKKRSRAATETPSVSQPSKKQATGSSKSKSKSKSARSSTGSLPSRRANDSPYSGPRTPAEKPEIGERASETNLILSDISKNRGAEGSNSENFARCAKVLDIGDGIPLSAAARLNDHLKEELDHNLHKPIPYPDTGRYSIDGDLETCLSLSELFSVCPKELLQQSKQFLKTPSMSAPFPRKTEVKLPGYEGSKFICAANDDGWAAWARVEGSSDSETGQYIITIWSPEDQTFTSMETISEGVKEGSITLGSEELSGVEALVTRLRIRVKSNLGFQWWRSPRTRSEGQESKIFSTLHALVDHVAPSASTSQLNASGESEQASAGETNARATEYKLTCMPVGLGGLADKFEAQEEAMNLARAFIECLFVPSQDSGTEMTVPELTKCAFEMFSTAFPSYVAGSRKMSLKEFGILMTQYFVGSEFLPARNAMAASPRCEFRKLGEEDETAYFRKVMAVGLGFEEERVSNTLVTLSSYISENCSQTSVEKMRRQTVAEAKTTENTAGSQPGSGPAMFSTGGEVRNEGHAGNEQQAPSTSGAEFRTGDTVTIFGLTGRQDLNGFTALIKSWDSERDAWIVVPDREVMSQDSTKRLKTVGLRAKNLRLLRRGDSPQEESAPDRPNMVPQQLSFGRDSTTASSSVIPDGGLLTNSAFFDNQASGHQNRNQPVDRAKRQMNGQSESVPKKRRGRPVQKRREHDMDSLDYWKGMRLTKEFVPSQGAYDGPMAGFIGKVESIQQKKGPGKMPLFRVKYEDNDCEDMDITELDSLLWSDELTRDIAGVQAGDMVAFKRESQPGEYLRFNVGKVLEADSENKLLKIEMYKTQDSNGVPLSAHGSAQSSHPRFGPRGGRQSAIHVPWGRDDIFGFGFDLDPDGSIEQEYAEALMRAGLLNPQALT